MVTIIYKLYIIVKISQINISIIIKIKTIIITPLTLSLNKKGMQTKNKSFEKN